MDNLNENNWVNYIPKPGVFIDIGVKSAEGHGHTLEAKKIHEKWPEVTIVGFEPHPARFGDCFGKYPGILWCCAVGSEDKTETFYDLDAMAVRTPRERQDKSKSIDDVIVRSLDSLEKQHGPWKDIFIWSDTEGCEMEILKGSKSLFESGKIIGLNLELWRTYQAENWAQSWEVIFFLSQYGFEIAHKWESNQNDPQQDVIFLRK